MATLYDNIILLAKKHGMSGSRFLETAGVDKSALSNLKNGRVERLSAKSIEKISECYHIPADWILNGVPEDAVFPDGDIAYLAYIGEKKEPILSDELVKDIDLNAFENYLKLSPTSKQLVRNFLQNLLTSESIE